MQDLADLVAEEQATRRLPSLVVGLVRDGVVIWWGTSGTGGLPDGGPATTDTQYRIGSITKTFVAVCVLRLRDEGALDLGDAVGDHIAELADLPVSVAQLLSHTSGLRAETPAPWWERTPGHGFSDLVASSLRPGDLLWRPGRRFHYSNPGFAVLGELISRKRSAPFGAVIRHELLEPLGMSRTTLRPAHPHAEGLAVHPHADAVMREPEHDAGAMAPAGQLWSTIGDLARWSEVLVGKRPEILKADSLAEMTEPIGLMDIPAQPWIEAYGLGLMVRNQAGQRRYGHSGGMPGHWAMLLIDKTSEDVVVGLANSTYKGFRLAFFDELLSLVSSEQPRPRARFQPAAGSRPAPAAAGRDMVLGAGRIPSRPSLRRLPAAQGRSLRSRLQLPAQLRRHLSRRIGILHRGMPQGMSTRGRFTLPSGHRVVHLHQGPLRPCGGHPRWSRRPGMAGGLTAVGRTATQCTTTSSRPRLRYRSSRWPWRLRSSACPARRHETRRG